MRNFRRSSDKWLVSSKRDQSTANSGIVVELKLEDFKAYAKYGVAGMEFQRVSSKGLASSW
jgi:hypothetical protein